MLLCVCAYSFQLLVCFHVNQSLLINSNDKMANLDPDTFRDVRVPAELGFF